MSVSFYPTIDATIVPIFFIECADGERRDAREGVYGEIAPLLEVHRLTCEVEDCRVYGPMLETTEQEPLVNVSVFNARHILEALGLVSTALADGGLVGEGFESDALCGEVPAEEFLARVLLARGLAPADEGLPAYTEGGNGHTTIINCGRAPGYLQDRLESLTEVGEWARENGRSISWA